MRPKILEDPFADVAFPIGFPFFPLHEGNCLGKVGSVVLAVVVLEGVLLRVNIEASGRRTWVLPLVV